MSLVFAGTPEFAVPSLRALHDVGHEIALVITQPDRPAGRGRALTPSPVKSAALSLGLPILQPETFRAPGIADHLRSLDADAFVVVAYGEILRPEILSIPTRGVLNVHASLLPRWRGASPIPAAILAGDTETGVTIMLMDEGLDTGPILTQRSIPIADEDTTATLTPRLAELGAGLLSETLPRWLADDLTALPQDDATATTCRTLRKEDGRIDWRKPADHVSRMVRAYDPWPGAYTALNGETLRIWRARPSAREEAPTPAGTVVFLTEINGEKGFTVQTGDGLLAVLEAQRAGRRRMTSSELLAGMPGLIGSVLG
jgi:methionyl-tRNA formyltransferase